MKMSSVSKDFQSESTASGEEYERIVKEDLISRGYTILETNVDFENVSIIVSRFYKSVKCHCLIFVSWMPVLAFGFENILRSSSAMLSGSRFFFKSGKKDLNLNSNFRHN